MPRLHDITNKIFSPSTEKCLLGILFFSMGFQLANQHTYFRFRSLIFLSTILYLVLFFKSKDIKKLLGEWKLLTLSILMLSFFYSLYIFFEDPIVTQLQTGILIKLSFFHVIFFAYIAATKSWDLKKTTILCFSFGAFSFAAYAVAGSLFTNYYIFGYKRILNPFTGHVENSPIYSNLIAIGFCALMIILTSTQNRCKKLLSSITLIITAQNVLFILGRTFFLVCSFFFLCINVIYRKEPFKIIPLWITAFLALILMVLLYKNFLPQEGVHRFDRIFLNRLSSLVSKNEPRYMLWNEGAEGLISSPHKGTIPTVLGSKITSYHNVWLDIWRFSGLLPLSLFFITNLVFASQFFIAHKQNDHLVIWILGLIFLLIISQDHVIESRLIVCLYGYFLTSLSFCSLTHKQQ